MNKLFGIGNDIVKISRLEASFKRHGDKFLKRAFNDVEISIFKSLNPTPSITEGINENSNSDINNENNNNNNNSNKRGFEYLAGRWAAKESIYKAIGNQDRSKLNFQNIQILNEPNGRPYVNLLEPTQTYFKELGINKIHIAISHDTDYAISNVILESNELKKN
ncbi:hypothetical protein RB653_002526 [Dictyostelium firmibasis]|uniref:4'-phosphopantetheinyl transferase domain-containing protein n=1 Tax=Dictyostelium firmibasis TaxID=79012 RepID=A0AAN7TXZ6_9MYCE